MSMLRLIAIKLVLIISSFSCGNKSDGQEGGDNGKKDSAQAVATEDAKGTVNGNAWQFVDGRARTYTYQGKKMLSINLVPFKYMNQSPMTDLGKCFHSAPASTKAYAEVYLRVPNGVGIFESGLKGFEQGILTNVQETAPTENGGKVVVHLGEGKVKIEEITDNTVSGTVDFTFQSADHAERNGKIAGKFSVIYCGERA